MRTNLSPAVPQPDGSLSVVHPGPATRFDFGNRRLFGAVDGAGGLLALALAEGVRLVRRWQPTVIVNRAAVDWQAASAFARRIELVTTTAGLTLNLATVVDPDTAALVQQWTMANDGSAPQFVTLRLDVEFDLQEPGAPSAAATLAATPTGLLAGGAGGRLWLSADARPNMTDPTRGQIEWTVDVAPGQSRTIIWLLWAEAAPPDDWAAAAQRVLAAARVYEAWLRSCFDVPDPLLRSLYLACLNAALSMYKQLPSGFSGLWAGPGYAYPPRIYFRDGYWTAQAVLPFQPAWVRAHLLALAEGVHADGACPSGVFAQPQPALAAQAGISDATGRDWLPDHMDSPAFFILLAYDYVRWTGDWAVLDHPAGSRTVLAAALACARYLRQQDTDGDGLPEKPYAANDWADNVRRSSWVSYDVALYHGALLALAQLLERRGDSRQAAELHAWAKEAAAGTRALLWEEARGYLVDYRRPGFVEDHLALDTVLAIRFGLVDDDQAAQMLAAMRRLLQTRNNPGQPWGDWGVMVCYPPYRNPDDLFSKSAEPYRYHSGAEWPYLSALYAQALLERDPAGDDWRYALTRWWAYGLEQGWLTPVEYASPPYPPGAFLQGWSSLVVAAMLAGGLGLDPDLDGRVQPRSAPWGACQVGQARIHGVER